VVRDLLEAAPEKRMQHMNLVAQGKAFMLAMGTSPVMFLLLALSVVGVAVAFERAWFFVRVSDDLEKLAKGLEAALEGGDVAAARAKMGLSPSAEAKVVLAGLAKADHGARAASEAMSAATAVQRKKLERGLAFLGTLGSNAPFVGLFGTVVGIIMAFDKLGETSGTASAVAPAAVMSSIAEALVATAIGLAVAIPSIAIYNYFQRRIRGIVSNTQALTHVLLSWLESRVPPAADPRLPPPGVSSRRPVEA
jgi:biopolymer transport protein ExbB